MGDAEAMEVGGGEEGGRQAVKEGADAARRRRAAAAALGDPRREGGGAVGAGRCHQRDGWLHNIVEDPRREREQRRLERAELLVGGFEGGVARQSELGDLEVDPRHAARARRVPPHARRRADLAHDLKVLARRLLVDDAAGARLRPVGARFDREEAAHLRVVGEQRGLAQAPAAHRPRAGASPPRRR